MQTIDRRHLEPCRLVADEAVINAHLRQLTEITVMLQFLNGCCKKRREKRKKPGENVGMLP